MTATEKYKRAEALFNDRTKRELADMVVHREADLEDARAENAKLREQIDAAHMSRLLTENENESLRELLHRLLVEYRYLRVRPRKMYLQHEARMRAIEGEMRELGIEVNA